MNARVLLLLAVSVVEGNQDLTAVTLDDLSVSGKCHWRQTTGCSKSGAREPKHDGPCSAEIAMGTSGFCDCNGDGKLDGHEPGYDCKDGSPKNCIVACEATASAATPAPAPATPAPPEATPEPAPAQQKVAPTPSPTTEAPTPAPPPTPPPANLAKHYLNQYDQYNVMDTFKKAINTELENSKCPPAIAAVALVLGWVFLFNGEKSFNAAVTFSTAVVAGIIAKQSCKSYWEGHKAEAVSSTDTVANLAGFEVALVFAVGAHYGNKGMLMTIGAAAGFFVAHFVSEFLVTNFHIDKMHQVEVQVAWYSVICLAASYAVYDNKHLHLMAFVSPIVGGVLTASALLYFVTEAFVGFSCKHPKGGDIWHSEAGMTCPNGLTPRTGEWISFFKLAFKHTRAKSLEHDYGIFYNQTWNFMSGSYTEGSQTQGFMILIDHVVSVALWIVLALIGIRVQRKAMKNRATNDNKLRSGAVVKAAAQGA